MPQRQHETKIVESLFPIVNGRSLALLKRVREKAICAAGNKDASESMMIMEVQQRQRPQQHTNPTGTIGV